MNNSSDLDKSILSLNSIGTKRAQAFENVGLKTVKDLLFYFPSRYLDRSSILTSVKVINYLVNGYDGEVTIIGKVVETEFIRRARKQVFKVTMKDAAGFFDCVWFQGIKFFRDRFKEGQNYAVSAKPVLTRYGHLQFVHPDFDFIADDEDTEFRNTGKIIPFYRIPKELKSTNIGDLSLRRIMQNTINEFCINIPETLPDEIRNKNNLPGITKSVRNLHFPETDELLKKSRQRFIFEEFFYLETLIAGRKNKLKTTGTGVSKPVKSKLVHKFLEILPFKLTGAQLSALSEIRKDMESPEPMNRLLQGDVGSGKTIVSLIAMLICVDNGYQSILMAPTEILANQHYKKFSELLKPFGIKVFLLLGNQKKSRRNEILNEIEHSPDCIIIGTHALIQESVTFGNPGLIVIDEQHRFGVGQRMQLTKKANTPDVLIMTATPIPRTLTMTLYGDLDVSVINQMPENRLPVKTLVRSEEHLPQIYKFIKEKISGGNQCFIVFPLVEESDKSELKDAISYFEKLSNEEFSEYKTGLIHGKMNWQEKEQAMLDFAGKKFDILISTTVIEVGIDVPDANIILINDAYRFGLSQLHQLRGRVGRGDKQGYCILIGKENKLKSEFDFNFEYLSRSEIEKQKSAIRLNAMINFTDGFKIAEIDFKLRGPGDILGTQQSGFPELKYGNIFADFPILENARTEAFQLIKNDPDLKKPENKIIRKTLIDNYSNRVKYADIG